MKNLMGLNFAEVNRTFHTGDFKTKPDDIDRLDQCIADLNLAVKPTLCVIDATEFITTNGPFGPGVLASAPQDHRRHGPGRARQLRRLPAGAQGRRDPHDQERS